MGTPFTVFVTFHPRRTHEMSLAERLNAFRRVRVQYDQFARRHRFTPAYVYTREVALETSAEHMHMLCHMPKKHREKFLALANGWGDEPGACHAREARTKGFWSQHGYWFSDLNYICKQMSPQAAFRRPYNRISGAPIEGARWNASRNVKQG